MAKTDMTQKNLPIRVDEYLCGDCRENFVVRCSDEPECGTELEF